MEFSVNSLMADRRGPSTFETTGSNLLKQRLQDDKIDGKIIFQEDLPPDAHIVKSLIWTTLPTLSPFVLVLNLDQKVNYQRIEALIHSKVSLTSKEQAVSLSGYGIGTIPPCGHASKLPVYVDHQVILRAQARQLKHVSVPRLASSHEYIYGGGG